MTTDAQAAATAAISVDTPQVESLTTKVAQHVEAGLDTDEEYIDHAELLTQVKALRQAIADHHKPIIADARRTVDTTIAARNKLDAPLEAAETTLKDRIAAYVERREREARIDLIEREAAAVAAEDEGRLREAEALERAGRHDEAQALLDAPGAPPPVPGPKAGPLPKVRGVNVRQSVEVVITDPRKLVQAALDGRVPFELITFDDKLIKANAKALGHALSWPGTETRDHATVAAGTGGR